MRTLRIAILECDVPIEQIREQYPTFGNMFQHVFKQALEQAAVKQQFRFIYERWDVYTIKSYPNPGEMDGLVLTGSKHNAFDNDSWILELVQYVRQVYHTTDKPMVGICFGHQIIARAMGATISRNPKGREISVCGISLSHQGQELFGTTRLSLYQSHQDNVLLVPDGFYNLGSSPKCDIQGLYQDGRVFTLQGHPEFNHFIMKQLLDSRHSQGIWDDSEFEQGSSSVGDAHDGVLVGDAMVRFLASIPMC